MVLFNSPVHLGDTDSPMIFPGVPFIGLRLSLPLTLPPVTASDELILRFTTSKIETWAEWQNHKVYLQDKLIGILTDANDTSGDSEVRTLIIAGNILLQLPRHIALQIEIGQQEPGLADDFLLKQIDAEGVSVQLGWVTVSTDTFHGSVNEDNADLPK